MIKTPETTDSFRTAESKTIQEKNTSKKRNVNQNEQALEEKSPTTMVENSNVVHSFNLFRGFGDSEELGSFRTASGFNLHQKYRAYFRNPRR
jgi:hypothetical protein